MTKRRVAIVGGGAAGMMAAIFAAGHGDDVTVYEKNPKIGRKLYITGKGRCNLTNNCSIQTVIANTPTNGRFLYSALGRFSPADTMAFFEKHGLPLKTERGNRVFPVSDKAADVVDTLFFTAKQSGCKILHRTVEDICIENGAVRGVIVGGSIDEYDKIIIACGGRSYPLTGSTGDGYRFAQKAGHTVVPQKPSLVPLETKERIPPAAAGLLLKNIAVTLYDTRTGKKIFEDFGEVQLMSYGLAGAVILSASSHIREMEGGRYQIMMDLKPALSQEKLNARLLREIAQDKGKTYEYLLRSLLPAGMTGLFVTASGVPSNRNCSEMTKEERMAVIKTLKSLTFTIRSFRPIEEAIITSGGVSVKEINPRTMESKLVSGLYFAGEVIDVDCYTGGFNLQTAFSTGVLAGDN